MANVPTTVVNTFAADIAALEGDVSTVQTDLNTAESDISTLQTDLGTAETNIDAIRYGVTSTLQTATTNDKENEVSIELATGTYLDTTTVNVINGLGGGWRGKGAIDCTAESSASHTRNHTIRQFDGTKTGTTPHILYERGGFYMEHLTLLGKTPTQILNDTGTNTPIGIQVRRATGAYAGIGTGKLYFNNVFMGGYDIGINRADGLDGAANANCDENSYYNMLFARCGVGFQSNNAQGLSDKFYNLRVGNTPVMFNYLAGGKLHVTDTTMFQANTLLKLNNDTPGGYGPNGSRWTFRGVDLDSGARNAKLLDCEAGMGIYGHIIFDGVHLCRNGTEVWDNECWHMGEIGLLTIKDAFGLQAGMIKVTAPIAGSKTTIIVENSVALNGYITTAPDLIHEDSSGSFRLIVRNLLEVDSTSLLVDSYNQVLTY
jgi:hypothetical protein